MCRPPPGVSLCQHAADTQRDKFMPIMFNTILLAADFRLADVRLLRHKDKRAAKGRTPYELWRDNRPQFDLYQVYDLTLEQRFADLVGKLLLDWGPGDRAWIQRADQQDKRITELRTEFKEPDFPGFLNFIESLSRLDKLPKGWIAVLQFSRGIYLLTCPRTKEQYVGKATGEGGFWRRWQDYIQTGHGGDLALKSRDPSDYQVSILEVAGTASTMGDIIKMERRWKSKLQSREMGLNRN